MTDEEREGLAIWKLGKAGFTVRKEGGIWFVHDEIDAASMDNLPALVELAEAVYEAYWAGRKVTPSA